MNSMDSRHLSPEALNEQRRLAVRLRREGLKLSDVSTRTGLSAPTIISATKAFERGGWEAVDVRPRGRPAGGGQLLTTGREMEILAAMGTSWPEEWGLPEPLWTETGLQDLIRRRYQLEPDRKTVLRYLTRWGLPHSRREPAGGGASPALLLVLHRISPAAVGTVSSVVVVHRGHDKPGYAPAPAGELADALLELLRRLPAGPGAIHTRGFDPGLNVRIRAWLAEHPHVQLRALPEIATETRFGAAAARSASASVARTPIPGPAITSPADPLPTAPLIAMPHSATLTHLQRLEAESIHIMREVVAEADNPVMLYSIGKDSAVMLHLAMKAFHPAPPPFPLLHVDTGWKFREMYAFRDRNARELALDLRIYTNPEGVEKGINPFTHGSTIHTDIMKTEALKQALDKYGFDTAFGGARRDEEKSRAKERIFSFRTSTHRWDPKNQRPELWKLYNARKHKGESIRVFPLSNWTELDVWQYIYREHIPIVPLYFSAVRPVVERDGALIMVDDDRMPLSSNEVPMMKKVRFRTLGCYPLTGAIESEADTLPAIIREMLLATTSERQGRVIDHDAAASMEKKKQEGYF